MALNPEVSVRERGVMEKCTLCVHRIRYVTSGIGKPEKPKSLKDGEIKTACQETCPTDAIVFGDLNDPNSQVRKLFEAKRTYSLLEDLNTRPRIRYMSRVRNADRASAAHEEHGEAAKHGRIDQAQQGEHV
jgi:molybdopterin-containing oxidoreductase family iron-sulfur binding subunit